jgi:hypothetical protein
MSHIVASQHVQVRPIASDSQDTGFLESAVLDRYRACDTTLPGSSVMTRITALTQKPLQKRLLLSVLWLAIALLLTCAARADEHAVSASLHRSAAQAQQHAEHLGYRMQATAHRLIDATSRGLHHAFDATARGTRHAADALERAADKARSAFHSI